MGSVLGSEAVAEPADGLDQRAGAAELRPQSAHVHIHRSRFDIGRGIPDGLEQGRAALRPATTLDQADEQLELLGRKLDLDPFDRDPVRADIYGDGPRAQQAATLRAGSAGGARRSTALTRSTSSLGLKGFDT